MAASVAGGEVVGIPTNVLCSYHYFKNIPVSEIRARCAGDLLIDSGGFSAMTLGTPIDIDAYATYVASCADIGVAFINLDVVRDHKTTARNQTYLEALGLNPIPVFHIGSPFGVLDAMTERYPYIALGGLVGASPKSFVRRWINKCFNVAPDTQFHGLGMTSNTIARAFPWFSVDSSSWLTPARWGSMPIFKNGSVVNADQTRLTQRERVILRELGVDINRITDRDTANKNRKLAASAAAYLQFQEYINKKGTKWNT